MTQKRSKATQPKVIVEFNGQRGSDYQAFENEDGSVDLYYDEKPVMDFETLGDFIKWMERDE